MIEGIKQCSKLMSSKSRTLKLYKQGSFYDLNIMLDRHFPLLDTNHCISLIHQNNSKSSLAYDRIFFLLTSVRPDRSLAEAAEWQHLGSGSECSTCCHPVAGPEAPRMSSPHSEWQAMLNTTRTWRACSDSSQ